MDCQQVLQRLFQVSFQASKILSNWGPYWQGIGNNMHDAFYGQDNKAIGVIAALNEGVKVYLATNG